MPALSVLPARVYAYLSLSWSGGQGTIDGGHPAGTLCLGSVWMRSGRLLVGVQATAADGSGEPSWGQDTDAYKI